MCTCTCLYLKHILFLIQNRDVDLRVIFLNMYENEARRILCEVSLQENLNVP